MSGLRETAVTRLAEASEEGRAAVAAGKWVICALTRTARPDGTTEWVWHGSQPVSDSEAADAQHAISILTEEAEQKQLNFVLGNMAAFLGYIASLPHEWDRARADAVNPVDRLQTELATRLFSWLESIRAYLNHSERRLKRRFGADSDHVRSLKRATAKEFDEVFAYRFFYKLRNYGHVDFPPLRLSLNERLVDSQLHIKADVLFRRNDLLAQFDDWGPVRADLVAQPEEFPVAPLMADMMGCLEQLRTAVGVIEAEAFDDAMKTLARLRARLGNVDGTPILARLRFDDDGSIRQSQMIDLPLFVAEVGANRRIHPETRSAADLAGG